MQMRQRNLAEYNNSFDEFMRAHNLKCPHAQHRLSKGVPATVEMRQQQRSTISQHGALAF